MGITRLDMDSRFDWGKHRGKTVAEVVQLDPDYIRWLRDKVMVVFDKTVQDALPPVVTRESG